MTDDEMSDEERHAASKRFREATPFPTTLAEAIEFSRQHEAVAGWGFESVANPELGVYFHLENRTVASMEWDGDDIVEIVRCCDTGREISRSKVEIF